MKKIYFLFCCILLIITLGCQQNQAKIKAIYLVPNSGGVISQKDLEAHPEIKVIHTADELKLSAKYNVAIWVDKHAVNLIEKEWFEQWPQKSYVTAFIGCGDVAYAHNLIGGFWVTGIFVHDPKLPGFSVWKLWREDSTGKSAFLMGYTEPVTIQNVLSKTDILLEGKNPKVNQN